MSTLLRRSLVSSCRTRAPLGLFLRPTALRYRTLSTTPTPTPTPTEYEAPLTATFRRLKIFSLSSLSLSVVMSPFMFLLETSSGLPVFARFALIGIALGTSSISTALVAWCGKPYVIALERLDGGAGGVAMTTSTFALNKRVTRVYDTAFLVDTPRPFAKWELAKTLQLDGKNNAPGTEETVAETVDAKGKELGRWIVKWDENGRGTCREVGKMTRYAQSGTGSTCMTLVNAFLDTLTSTKNFCPLRSNRLS